MNDNSDLTPVQNAGSTGNPQSDNGNIGASDSASFQQSAGVDTLSENRPLSVAQTGKPLKGNAAHGGSLLLMWVFVVVASLVLVMIASSVFKWVMKRPEPVKDTADKPKKITKTSDESKKSAKVEKAAVKTVPVVRPNSKKKLPRSKRNKK